MRPLQNAPFCPISVSGSNFNPQNTICIRACPVGPEDRTGWLKFSPSLNLNKIEHFSKVSLSDMKLIKLIKKTCPRAHEDINIFNQSKEDINHRKFNLASNMCIF